MRCCSFLFVFIILCHRKLLFTCSPVGSLFPSDMVYCGFFSFILVLFFQSALCLSWCSWVFSVSITPAGVVSTKPCEYVILSCICSCTGLFQSAPQICFYVFKWMSFILFVKMLHGSVVSRTPSLCDVTSMFGNETPILPEQNTLKRSDFLQQHVVLLLQTCNSFNLCRMTRRSFFNPFTVTFAVVEHPQN